MDTMKDTKMQPATDAVIEEQLLELPFDTVMTVTEVIAKLRQFNEWRRCDYGPAEQPEPPNPYEVGLAIYAAVEMLDRLEAAEKERDALRAKIEAMEKQEPVAEWTENRFHHYPQLVWNEKYRVTIGDKLYALPGAQTQGE